MAGSADCRVGLSVRPRQRPSPSLVRAPTFFQSRAWPSSSAKKRFAGVEVDSAASSHGSTPGVITMATLPTTEESARAILAIFKVMGFGSGVTLQRDQVEMQFGLNVGKAADFSSGVQYGVDHGWFELPSTRTIKLADAGFAEM